MSLESVSVPAGRSTTYHSHNQDLFFVITSGAKIKNQPFGKDPVDLDFKLGNVYFAPYTKNPGVHQITNVEEKNPLRLLGLGIVQPDAGRFTPSIRAAKYEVVMDNDRVRAWRLKLAPGGYRRPWSIKRLPVPGLSSPVATWSIRGHENQTSR